MEYIVYLYHVIAFIHFRIYKFYVLYLFYLLPLAQNKCIWVRRLRGYHLAKDWSKKYFVPVRRSELLWNYLHNPWQRNRKQRNKSLYAGKCREITLHEEHTVIAQVSDSSPFRKENSCQGKITFKTHKFAIRTQRRWDFSFLIFWFISIETNILLYESEKQLCVYNGCFPSFSLFRWPSYRNILTTTYTNINISRCDWSTVWFCGSITTWYINIGIRRG